MHSATTVSASAPTPRTPYYLIAIVLSSFSIIIGLIWDISWHLSIGRDGLFSAPHLAIYAGGVVAGIFSGYHVLRVTLTGSPFEKAQSVHFWGVFYGSLGDLFCIWGAIAMLTSAPFDDWWHNTYGLDVTILSPPHTVLLLGMIMIQFGAIVSVLTYKNAHAGRGPALPWLDWLLPFSQGFILLMIFTMASEYLGRHDMHAVFFYQITAFIFPMLLVAFAVSSQKRWGATQAAIVYTLFLLFMNWILPLFPATPRLGPVLNPITRFQPFEFPLMLVVPAAVIDMITLRFGTPNAWLMSLRCGVAFVVLFFMVQWPLGSLLMASKGHYFFGTSQWYFGSDPSWEYRYAYAPWMVSNGTQWLTGMPIAAVIAVLSARVGLMWGTWMKKIIR